MYKMHNNMILNKINSMGGYFPSSIKIYQYAYHQEYIRLTPAMEYMELLKI